MGYHNDGGISFHHFIDPFFAFLLEFKIADGKDLINDQNIRCGHCRDSKSNTGNHTGGIVLHRSVQKVLHFGKFYDLIEFFIHELF